MTTIPTDRLYTGWFLAVDDEHEHAVTDEEFVRASTGGLPEAVCGHEVPIASCMSPPGPRCLRCECYLAARQSLPDLPFSGADYDPRPPCDVCAELAPYPYPGHGEDDQP